MADSPGTEEDQTTVTVPASGSKTVTLTWQTDSDQAPTDYLATVIAATDVADTTVTVVDGEFLLTLDGLTFVKPATFDVAVASTNSSVKPGNTLDVTTDVTNTGSEADTQEITLDIDGTQEDSRSVSVGAGGSLTTTLSWAVPSGQTEQDYTATVSSADDTASQTVTVGGSISALGDTQYYTDAGGGSTLTDELGTVDATISGASWQTGTGVNDGYLSFDGTDGYWSTDSTLTIDTATVAAWVRPDDYTSFDNPFVSWGDDISNNANDADRGGFYIGTEDTSGEILTVSGEDNESVSSIVRNHTFVSPGNWGFVGLIYDGSSHRLITWDTSQELADSSVSLAGDRQPTGAKTVYGGGDPASGRHLSGALDFVVLEANGTLSKSDLETLWNDTKGNY